MKLFEYIGTLERRELYSILNIFRLHQSPNDQRVVANKSNPKPKSNCANLTIEIEF